MELTPLSEPVPQPHPVRTHGPEGGWLSGRLWMQTPSWHLLGVTNPRQGLKDGDTKEGRADQALSKARPRGPASHCWGSSLQTSEQRAAVDSAHEPR